MQDGISCFNERSGTGLSLGGQPRSITNEHVAKKMDLFFYSYANCGAHVRLQYQSTDSI